MIEFDRQRLRQILSSGANKQIMVVGDLMIDRYLWGKVSRISPEAPVPIINIADEEVRFGGAANVANNLIELQAIPLIIGVIGPDKWGSTFRKRLTNHQLDPGGLMIDRHRPTTIKTRIIGNNQHVARVDREVIQPINQQMEKKIADYAALRMPDVDGVILEDYNKGLLTPNLIHRIIQIAISHNKIVTVDPKFDNFMSYRGVTLFKPNKKETAEALAVRLDTLEEVEKAGKILLKRLDAENVLITLGSQGMALFERNGRVSFTETRARKVADVSGAGDTVIATLTFAMAAGASAIEAAAMANMAAGAVCEEVGAVPITADKLLEMTAG